ncbi:MAG: type II secretion system F family protein [Pirellulaceae bacterium]
MTMFLIVLAVFVCVASLAGGVMMLVRGEGDSAVEDRLSNLVNRNRAEQDSAAKSLLDSDSGPTRLELSVARYINIRKLVEQAGLKVSPHKIILASLALGFASAMAWQFVGVLRVAAIPIGLAFGCLPLMYVLFMRKKRLKKFGAQLPEALDLIARALRAGHSLPAGFHLAAEQIGEPLGPEFGRCYDEQNLGLPLDEALGELTDRVPNVDLRFFATAVIIQRQTGGDLAEILDKISKLIRERFQIWGQIQALTGEGRLSGIVLMVLPPALFLVMLRINYDYIMKLFEDPLGHKMLAAAIILQVLGGLAIRKIVNIKV